MKVTKQIDVSKTLVYEFRNDTFQLVKQLYGANSAFMAFPVRTWRQLKNTNAEQLLITQKLLKWSILSGKDFDYGVIPNSQSTQLTGETKIVPITDATGLVVAMNNDVSAITYVYEQLKQPLKCQIQFVDPLRAKQFRRVASLLVTGFTPANIVMSWLYNGAPVTNFIVLPNIQLQESEEIEDNIDEELV